MQKEKRKPAFYDPLTGLPKLNLLKNILTDYILQSSNKDFAGLEKFALVYLDIDNFKYLNETLGYKASGEVIKCVAEYLVSEAKSSNFVMRVAGDKFAIFFTDISSEEELYDTIDEIINNSCNISSSNIAFYVTMCAGVAMYPEHGKDISALMKRAEMALYSARKRGKDIIIYSDELQKEIIRQGELINKIQNAIEKEEFVLFYQPEYNLNTNEIIGVEALVRWFHPEEGLVSPDLFIPVAEKSKQIYALERWIVNKALQQKKQWENEGLDCIELSINLSSKTLESESNFQLIEKILKSYDIDFTKIIFEVTETFIISQFDMVIERIKRLRSYGIKIALDDFGTGYSSLTHLTKLPIDIIKIDKSFIKAIPFGKQEKIITQNIVHLAHNLKFRVVAEGIETKEQLTYLKGISCERGQGYLLCKPLPIERLYNVLDNNIEVFY